MGAVGDVRRPLLDWYRRNRRDLPWRRTRDPYPIWVSEVMLQQTTVRAVGPYYEAFLARFPTVDTLALASEEDVLAAWSGLGYYHRARNLHRGARHVVEHHAGRFPRSLEAALAVPGVGLYTASAVLSIAYGAALPVVDGNVRRVLARHAGVAGTPTGAATLARLWGVAEARLPERDVEAYTQGMMDLGAQVCTVRNPACDRCPVALDCVARVEGRTGELPGRRARAPKRRKRIGMLVVVSGGEVLLEKRPAEGIWGGLWSLPEIDAAADPRRELARGWGLAARSTKALAPFEHPFTHYTLEVTPWLVRPRRGASLAARDRATWLALAELAGAALPSPVRRLLERVSGSTL